MAVEKKLKAVVRRILQEQFADIQIEAINIRPTVDEDGDAVLIVKVVFDAERKSLDPRAAASLLRHLRPKIAEAGEDAFPVVSFIAKSELGKLKAEAV